VRFRQLDFRDTIIFLAAIDAKGFYATDQKKGEVPGRHLFPQLIEPGPPRAIISDNFAALHGVKAGDEITLRGRDASITLQVIGTMADYSWNRGTVVMDRDRFREVFHDRAVDVFDVYLHPGADHLAVREELLHRWRAEHAMVVLTREDLQGRIKGIIRRLYGIAYAQEIVVGIVAALGVVMALLISVLQRRRELGLLRAVGATRAQILRSVLAEATLMGFLGTIIGLLIGIPLEWYCVRVILFEEAGFLFPLVIPWLEAGVIAALAITVATLAGLGPAMRALRVRIPEAIAYE
jgi:putative ABC transport system permease protein